MKSTVLPYARIITTLLNKPPSQKMIIKIDPLCCAIHAFMLFLDELAQEIGCVLYAFLQFESSKFGPKN